MCLVALALGQHPRFPLVLASNRDEFFDREALPLARWQPEGGGPALLSGRDLSGGGTWLGLSEAGRLALLTNVRAPGAIRPEAPSRGAIVLDWLGGDTDTEAFAARHLARPYSGFNALTADLQRGDWQWFSNHPEARRAIGPGVWGLSNAAFDTPWPKVDRLKARLAAALARADDVETLAEALFTALADRAPAPVSALPRTGIPPEREQLLSSAFIDIPAAAFGRAYGTRCSTLVIGERRGGGGVTTVIERSFEPGGRRLGERRQRLEAQ
jgi:uncharacterized protein with NRDE domain